MGGRIVVGVDGSAHSRRAVHYAFEQARQRDAIVEVVHAYRLPDYWPPPGYSGSIPGFTHGEAEHEAYQVIDRTIGQVPSDVQIQRIATHGLPADTLLRIARGADLLVVGSRGRGGFRGLLLGSTSHQVISHAPCPVTVIPHASSAAVDTHQVA